MDNREKIILAIEKAKRQSEEYAQDTIIIPFKEADMILSLLKEQETIFLKDGHHVRCTNCGEYWCDSDREGNPFPMDFCPHCGKAAKWE